MVLDSLPSSRLFNLGENFVVAKGKKSKTETTDTKVTRIKATDTTPAKTKTAKKEAVPAPSKELAASGEKRRNPLRASGDYFKGAWYELKQVRWPTRRATWGMTAALLGFTAFFVVFILLLDALFKYLFELILG